MSPRLKRRAMSPFALVIVAVSALVAGILTVSAPAPAQAAELPSSIMEGGFIISDAEFFDHDSLTAAQIQTFLNARVTTCKATTGPTCLKLFTTDLPAKVADTYCKAVAARKGATAAQVISAVATACGINPKVILTMLQKEQGLVTATAPSDWSYRAAMGQACPDTAPCDEAAAGFVNQVYKGARQLQVYTKNPTSFNYRAGQVNTIKWHPTSSCGSSKVFIQNQATANLYIYTPYRANVAALAAGTGTGDSCSTYGNRNFYNYYVTWFAPGVSTSTGAPAQVSACTVPVAADIAVASGTATVATATKGQKAPTKSCTTGAVSYATGAKLTVTGAYGAWVRVSSGTGSLWVLRSALTLTLAAPASSGNVCGLPAESAVTKASGTAVVTTSTLNARKAPSTSCETGKTSIKMGAAYARTATYGVWWRITINGAPYWVHSAYVALQAPVSPTPTATPKPTATPTATPKPTATPTATPKPTATPTATPKPTATPTPTPTATPSPAPAPTMYTKVALHVRSTPGSTSVVATLLRASKVSVVAVNGAWSSVRSGTISGWVDSRHLAATAPAMATAVTLQTTTSVPVRIAAATSGKLLTTLAKGTKVTVVDATGSWRAVKVGTVTGWVDGRLLGAVTAATTTMQTTTALNLRASASTTATVLTTLAKGTKVSVIGASGVWRKVTVSGRTGWLHSQYLTAVTASSTTIKTTTVALNLRASASSTAKVIAVLAQGTKVTVTASSGLWRKVTAGSRVGWVHSAYLR